MRVVVVGSGLAGLIASAFLRRQAPREPGGLELVMLERARTPGGRARSIAISRDRTRSAGARMNLGPRAVYRDAPLHRALRSLGVPVEGFTPPNRGAWTLAMTPERELAPLPGSLTDLMGASLLDAKAKRAFALALARVTVGALDVDDGMSIATWLDHHGGPPRARALLETLLRVTTYSNDFTHDAALALRQLRRGFTKGVIYVDGGWQTLVDGLMNVVGATSDRATFHCNVERLADIDADRIVLALPAHEARALVAGLPEVPEPITASCLDLSLSALPEPKRRVCFGLGASLPFYFSVHTAPGAPGPFRVHAMVNGAAAREEIEALVDVVQPGWRDHLVDGASTRYLSRMIVASALPRAGSARTPLTLDGRVFFAGDHVDCGALLADAAAQSAVHAAHAIMNARAPKTARAA